MKKIFYRIDKGDTVISVSRAFNVPASLVICDNNLIKEVSEGDLIVIKKREERLYSVGLTDTSKSVAQKFCMSEEEFLKINKVPYIYYGMIVIVK